MARRCQGWVPRKLNVGSQCEGEDVCSIRLGLADVHLNRRPSMFVPGRLVVLAFGRPQVEALGLNPARLSAGDGNAVKLAEYGGANVVADRKGRMLLGPHGTEGSDSLASDLLC